MEKIDILGIEHAMVSGNDRKTTYMVPVIYKDGKISELYQEFDSIEPRHVESFLEMLSNTGYNGIMAMTPEGSCDQEAMDMISNSERIQLYSLNCGEYVPKVSICKPEADSKVML